MMSKNIYIEFGKFGSNGLFSHFRNHLSISLRGKLSIRDENVTKSKQN